ncbi:MAG TPA: thioredoxin family protein [Spirochaetia bacterium]|nr:thioredoxin family protein [Spirochaetia bacterium]
MAGLTSLAAGSVSDEGALPDLGGAIAWLNSAPPSGKSLRGKVVLVDFWTYTCINSLRPLPYLKAWAEKYKDAGLVVIGVHTPEFSFEKEGANVEAAVRRLEIAYPVAIDSGYRIWEAFDNQYWPAMYFVDGQGRIRHHVFGEGEYVEAERILQALLHENGARWLDGSSVSVAGEGIEAAPSTAPQSPETYIGYRRGERFGSGERPARDVTKTYRAPEGIRLDHWGLIGPWTVGAESAALEAAGGRIVFRFRGRDLHLVLAPATDGKPVRFRVRVDATEPGDTHGVDSAPDGHGEVREPRLYQLVRQRSHIKDRSFEIEFLDAGVRAVVFTFG